MVEEKSLQLGHAGFVHDMALDHYGRRMATCSEDGVIKIFRRSHVKEGWEYVTETTPPTSSAILKLSWSHPEFSMLLACSTDHSVILWEEEDEKKWRSFTISSEFKSSITSIEFSPKHLGLRLAVATTDGQVQIFAPTDALRREWITRHSFNLALSGPSDNLSCSISWNTFPFDSPSMAISKGKTAFIWRMDGERKRWREVARDMNHSGSINHVAWAPNMGRSFHMVATASSDGTVKIWRVHKANDSQTQGDSVLGDDLVQVSLIQELKHMTGTGTLCEVFRVEWNLTATMLSTSGDDSVVRLWTPNLKGEWIHQSDLRMD